jgi:hypothetical protein
MVQTANGVAATATLLQTTTSIPSTGTSGSSSSSSNIALPIGITIAVVAIIALLVAFFFFRRKRKQTREETEESTVVKAAGAPASKSPNMSDGFFRSLKRGFSSGIGSPPPPAYAEHNKASTPPGMVELPGDTEHTAELPGVVPNVPTKLPSPPQEEHRGKISEGRNTVGLGLGLKGEEKDSQEPGQNEAPTRPMGRREDPSGHRTTTDTGPASQRQDEESDTMGIGLEGTSSPQQEGKEWKGAGIARGTLALSQRRAGSHVLSFMQYEPVEGEGGGTAKPK